MILMATSSLLLFMITWSLKPKGHPMCTTPSYGQSFESAIATDTGVLANRKLGTVGGVHARFFAAKAME